MRPDIASRRPGLLIGYHHFALFRGSLDGLCSEDWRVTAVDGLIQSG